MSVDDWIQIIALVVAVGALVIKRRGMKHYVAAGLFAAVYAEIVCIVAMNAFKLWSYPARLIELSPHPLNFNFVIVPIIAMFWLRYCPSSRKGIIFWVLSWSAVLTIMEFFFERHTSLIRYHNGYEAIFSFVLWTISFPLYLAFHHWLHNPGPIFYKHKQGRK